MGSLGLRNFFPGGGWERFRTRSHIQPLLRMFCLPLPGEFAASRFHGSPLQCTAPPTCNYQQALFPPPSDNSILCHIQLSLSRWHLLFHLFSLACMCERPRVDGGWKWLERISRDWGDGIKSFSASQGRSTVALVSVLFCALSLWIWNPEGLFSVSTVMTWCLHACVSFLSSISSSSPDWLKGRFCYKSFLCG